MLDDGSVLAAGGCEENARHQLMVVERKPAQLLEALEAWMAPFEEGEITMVVRSTEVPIITWTTRSAGMALYWTAVVLGKTWPPAATLRMPLPAELRDARNSFVGEPLGARPRSSTN
jgi:hypothetical protein